MGRSSAYIWRAAIESVEGLPPCPNTMNEPQYTALVFTLLCTVSFIRAWYFSLAQAKTDL